MDLKDKNILVIGLGISGVSTVKALNKLGAKISVYDEKGKESLKNDLKKIENIKTDLFLGGKIPLLEKFDLVIKNPGVPFDHGLILEAEKKGIDIVTDLELAYRLNLTDNLIVITGTNGKTTTTTLVGEIFKNAGKTTHIVGNIGLGILWELMNGNKEDYVVVEASSFQLDSCSKLKPKVSSILNISPDHLNWHKSFENYYMAKKKVLVNQDFDDFTILNYDDDRLKRLGENLNTNVIWFSRKEVLENGIFLDSGNLTIREDGNSRVVINKDELNIPGNHNIENALAAIGIANSMGVEIDIIRKTLKAFKSVEHRIEYVDTINKVNFYNDSKGTNIDASIKAIEAIDENIILIAGGADKGCSYDDFINTFQDRVKSLILLGETKYDIEKTALEYGFTNIKIVDNMREAIEEAYKNSREYDNVLLSPACASLDMYPSYEARGEDFKRNVALLKEV